MIGPTEPIFNKRGHRVAPRSLNDIRDIVHRFRKALNLKGSRVPVGTLVEAFMRSDTFTIEIVPDDQITEEAVTIPDRLLIKIKNSVYERACNNEGQARFTICHELGHLFLHKGQSVYARALTDHPTYCDSEWQANSFAIELLADNRLIDIEQDTAADLVERFSISRVAAGYRIDNLRSKK